MKLDRKAVVGLVAALLLCGETLAQLKPAIPPPDPRYKADILLIVAHPDDDTGASTYLEKAVFDEHKRVGVVFTNRGNAGPNAVGMEQSKALMEVREIEARQSLAARGITNVWFLDGTDTPTQDVLHSLETVNHGASLERVVRLIRLTRPEIVLTWLPAYVAGENHGDHQASGVIATEGFDLANDPTAFPEQVTPPRAHTGIANYGEGLRPWQAKKLYFFSDASHPDFLRGHGPTYLSTEICKAKGVPFSVLNRKAWEAYATQLDFNEETLRYFTDMPEYFILGKSLVPSSISGDVSEGLDRSAATDAPLTGFREHNPPGVSLSLGGPWAFYQQFYRVHNLNGMASLVPPQTALGSDRQLWIPLLLKNGSGAADVTLASALPPGWKEFTGPGTYHLEAGEVYPVQVFLEAPPQAPGIASPQPLKWTVTSAGNAVGDVDVSAYLEFDGVSQ